MKTYNQFLNTPFSEEVKPPEPPELPQEDPQIKSKEKRQMQIKKQVLLKKMQAVRAGAGADIVAGYEPEGEDLKEYSPNVTYQAKGGKKSGKLGKSSVYSLRGKDESKKDFRKSQVKDIKGGYLKTEEVVDERTLSSYIPSDRQGEASAANREYVKAQLKKKEDESTKNRGDLSKRDAGKMAKERLRTKKTMSMGEDKAFEYVKKQIAAKYGKSGYVSKDNPRKPQTAAEKAKARAHQAKVDKENAAARAKDPSQGRYPKG